LLSCSSADAADRGDSAADQWERALLEAKRNGTLPGPRADQQCVWSPELSACLWFKPEKFKLQPWIWRD